MSREDESGAAPNTMGFIKPDASGTVSPPATETARTADHPARLRLLRQRMWTGKLPQLGLLSSTRSSTNGWRTENKAKD